MKFNSKEEVCDWVNTKLDLINPNQKKIEYFSFLDWVVSDLFRPKKISVPIYTSTWKLKALTKLQEYFYQGTEKQKLEKWQPSIDYSKIIWADQWKTYPFKGRIATPKYTIKHNTCWEINLVHEFHKEDLQYGIRPMFAFRYTVDFGRGSLLVNSMNGDIYQLDSLLPRDYISAFEHYLNEDSASNLEWHSYKI